jgi:hypothetical protein
MQNSANYIGRGQLTLDPRLEFVFLERRIASGEMLGYSGHDIHGPDGPLGDLWNGLHLLLKKFASTAKSTPTPAPSCK